jgi:hypothetical protein
VAWRFLEGTTPQPSPCAGREPEIEEIGSAGSSGAGCLLQPGPPPRARGGLGWGASASSRSLSNELVPALGGDPDRQVNILFQHVAIAHECKGGISNSLQVVVSPAVALLY